MASLNRSVSVLVLALFTLLPALLHGQATAKDDLDYKGQKGSSVTADVSANDDLNGVSKASCKWKITDSGSLDQNGFVAMREDGTFAFTPDKDFVGKVEFKYELEENGNKTQATVKITIEDGLIRASDEERELIFSTGFNFDLIDGVKSDMAYLDLRANMPVAKFCDDALGFGMFASITRFRAFSLSDSGAVRYFKEVESISESDTTINYLTILGQGKRQTRSDNFAVSIAPSIDLFGPSGANKFRIVPGLAWHRTEFVSDYTFSDFDTTTTATRPVDWTPIQVRSSLPASTQRLKQTVDNWFWTVGIGYSHKNSFGILDIMAYWGCSRSMFTLPRDFGITQIQHRRGQVGGVRIEMTEHKSVGIRVGAEVRTLSPFKNEPPYPLLELNQAWFNVYLVKEFNLKKLAEFFQP